MAWKQTRSGKAFDLSNPDPRLVDFENDVAPALSFIARYNGHTQGDFPYTVAQHCVLGAETLYDKTGSRRLASLFLLHDAHEAYIGDITTPVVQRIDETCDGAFSKLLNLVKYQIDCAIYKAAGVDMSDEIEHAAIKHHDLAMMNAERLAIMAPSPHSWGARIEAIPAAMVLPCEIGAWDHETARDEWLSAFTRFIACAGDA